MLLRRLTRRLAAPLLAGALAVAGVAACGGLSGDNGQASDPEKCVRRSLLYTSEWLPDARSGSWGNGLCVEWEDE